MPSVRMSKIKDKLLKFHRWISHQKIIDPIFFLSLEYLPLWTYALLMGHNEIM